MRLRSPLVGHTLAGQRHMVLQLSAYRRQEWRVFHGTTLYFNCADLLRPSLHPPSFTANKRRVRLKVRSARQFEYSEVENTDDPSSPASRVPIEEERDN